MKWIKQMRLITAILSMIVILSVPAAAENVFEKEVEKEASAVKLLR
jgi:thiosulfate/3-mercaptopyruvate sulfurtransferase